MEEVVYVILCIQLCVELLFVWCNGCDCYGELGLCECNCVWVFDEQCFGGGVGGIRYG